ncbi:MAG TPA: Rap1a/Tai family immunity protein [Azospirillaceae bacterium]|nr:Rap1a/Tai family immunity protein [Azospirillaceae bacterium]
MPRVACTVLVMLAISAASSAPAGEEGPESRFDIRTVSDLVRLCETVPEHMDGNAAPDTLFDMVACLAYLRGALAVYQSYQHWNHVRVICIPDASTHGDQVTALLSWAAQDERRRGEEAALGLLNAMRYRFGCDQRAN